MTVEEITILLADARTAYHNLQTGTMARVIVDMDGQRTEFMSADRSQLYAYILKLEGMLPVTTPLPYGGPATFTF